MAHDDSSLDQLLDQASKGQADAADELLARHRSRLRRMVAQRIDPRVATRIDPSDVVQEALIEAAHRLPGYLRTRPITFYPWLRQIAWERLIDVHRRHLVAKRRTVTREESPDIQLSNESTATLAKSFLATGSHPSRRLLHEEMCRRVQNALAELSERDREILLLRYLEKLSTAEIAAVIGITEGAVKGRHRRAVEKLAELLEINVEGESL